MDGDQPVSQVTLQMLNSLLDTQTRLRDAAEARWTSAREALFGLARLVAADWLEQKQHEKGGLEAIRMEELSQVIHHRVSGLHAVSVQPEAGQLQKASERIDALLQEQIEIVRQKEKLELETQSLRKEIDQLQGENKRISRQNEKLKEVSSSGEGENTLPTPPWFIAWTASGGFERQSFIIRLIGDTGLARRSEIVKVFAEKFNIGFKTGDVSHVINRLQELGFVTKDKTAGTGHGAPPDILSLDWLGETTYILLTSKLPAENEYHSIRSAHSTDGHTILVLKAADVLTGEGYEILSKGEINIPLPDGRISSPDILARKDGREIHVEVERDVNKGNAEARERKWQNAFDAGQGNLYVICENERSQKTLVQEINRALASDGRLLRANTFMTNLDAIKEGRRHPDGSIWVAQKHTSAPK
jgi:hypothetical protein